MTDEKTVIEQNETPEPQTDVLLQDLVADEEQPAPQAKTNLVPVFVILVFIAAATTFALYYLWQQNQQLITQLSTQAGLQQRQQNELLLQLENQKQQIAQQSQTLAQSQQAITQQNAAQQQLLENTLAEYQQWITQSLAKTEHAWQDSSLAWRIEEIDFLLNSAYQTIMVRGDANTGVAMLQLADKKLSEIFQKDSQSVRLKIAEAMVSIQAWQPVDLLASYNRILAFEQQIDTWNWAQNFDIRSLDLQEQPEPNQAWYKRYQDYIKVRKVSEIDSEQLLAPHQLATVRFMILASSASLKHALANRDAKLFTFALNDLERLAQQYLADPQQKAFVAGQVNELRQVKLVQQRPNIYQSVVEFNQWKQELMPQ